MNYQGLRFFAALFLFATLGIGFAAAQQAAWVEPSAPFQGQTFRVYYNDLIGTLPDHSSQCWLHWGVVDQYGNWSIPPQSIWPAGSQAAGGSACQSPMSRGANDYWSVQINPTIDINRIGFVFTDQQGHWDNNNGQNWFINFVSPPTWWEPEFPLRGDLITLYYNTVPGTLPDGATNVKLHWGVNTNTAGQWEIPPIGMWPTGTTLWQGGGAVQSPMIHQSGSVWAVAIQTDASVQSLHFVFTDSVNWDNNDGWNWTLGLPNAYTYHTFRYDTRSAFATYGASTINYICIAGYFNDWSTLANPLTDPDQDGVYLTELLMPDGFSSYKFVINSTIWTQDPDLATTDGQNSLVNLVADALPHFTQLSPVAGTIFTTGQTIPVSALVRPSDFGPGIQGTPTLLHNGSPVSVSYNPTSGLLTASVTLSTTGRHTLAFSAQDSVGRVGTLVQDLGAYPANSGFHALDPVNDDNGPGSYSYPAGYNSAADLLFAEFTEAANGDSILFKIEMADLTVNSRALLQICTDVGGFYYDAPYFAAEVATPEWNGSGIQLCMADPASPAFNPAVHNRLIVHRDPVQTGAAVSLDAAALAANTFRFTLAVSDLEAIMGSYNRGWYFGVFSFLDGFSGSSGHVWEITARYGGLDATYDPDAYDALFVDGSADPRSDLQRIIFSNYSYNRKCTLDNEGRGFALIEPEQIGPHIASTGPQLTILTRPATTITPAQTIVGVAELTGPTTVTVHHLVGAQHYTYNVYNVVDQFNVNLTLEAGANTIYAQATQASQTGTSPAITLILDVDQAPDPEISTSAVGSVVTLNASASSDPQGQGLTFLWTADPDNPAPITLQNPQSAICTFIAPATPGEYYVDLLLEDTDHNQAHARTFAAVQPNSNVHAFEWNESAQWIQDAIVYEIFPRSYAVTRQLADITADLQRIYDAGYSAIWLMPVHPGPADHGYEITNYYDIEEDYGTLDDFADLVTAAHAYGIRIVIDLVINHSSIQHPFAEDALSWGIYSHNYNFYDHNPDGSFQYYYDWVTMPNLNYNNPEVWDYFIDMCKWWVQEYGVDGFRCDVAWGPYVRNPNFWVAWRDALKEIKPEIFLLAEANSTDFNYFNYRFDAAMNWELHHAGTVNFWNMFPGPPNLDQLHSVITNYGYSYPTYKYAFNFMENHDEARYISVKSADEAKAAAVLLFTVPGIPMVYAGQEVGEISQRGLINWSSDPNALQPYYRTLIQSRKQFAALRRGSYERLGNSQYSTVYSVGRNLDGEFPVITAINFAAYTQSLSITVPTGSWGINPSTTYCVNELLGGTHQWLTGAQLAPITTNLNAKSARLFVIADSVVTLPQMTVALEPTSLPIQIPASGGSFNYDITLHNGTDSTVVLDVWCMITKPNGQQFGPTLGPVHLTMTSGYTITRNRNQNVGAGAQAGLYSYNAYVGVYPSVIYDAAAFPFEKLATGNGPRIDDWACDGELFPGESNAALTNETAIPQRYSLEQNYPNPFNPLTVIRFGIPQAGKVELSVYNLLGQRVADLVDGYRNAGYHEIWWDASAAAAGLYFCRIQAGDYQAVKKLVLVK